MSHNDSNSEAVRNKLINTASALFAERGVQATSLGDISQVSQCSKGTLYYYYTTKEMLVADVCSRHITAMSHLIFKWTNMCERYSGIEEAFTVLVDVFTNPDLFDTKLHVALIGEAAVTGGKLGEQVKKGYDNLALLVDYALTAVTTPDAEFSARVSKTFFAMLDGYLLCDAIGLDVSKEQIVNAVVSL